MNSEIKTFEHPEFGSIRATEQNGEPWFCGKDVAALLGYANVKAALADHVDAEDKQILQRSEITTLENVPNRGMTFINESGLYSLVLSSKLPNAKKFKRWVTSEVLPAIRRTGGYIAAKEEDTPEEIMARALLIANDTIQRQKKQIEADRPKVSYCDEILRCENAILTTTIAKDYGMSAVAFNRKLNELGIQYKRGGTWFLYDRYADKGYTRSETYKYTDGDGRNCASVSTKWTQKGRLFLYEQLKEAGITPCVEQAS